MDSGAVNMLYCKALDSDKPDGFGKAGVGANISTELFNDFKAQAANFKSQGSLNCLEKAC
jgi:hypothetical protein